MIELLELKFSRRWHTNKIESDWSNSSRHSSSRQFRSPSTSATLKMVGIVPNLISIQNRKQKRSNCWHRTQKLKTGWQNNALNKYKFTNTEQRYFSKFLKQEYGARAIGPGAIK